MLIFFRFLYQQTKKRRFFVNFFFFETLFVTYRTHAKKSYVCVIVIFWGKIHISLNRFCFSWFFLFIPIFFFRDSFPFVLGREQFHSFFLTRKSVCVLKEIRNKKLTLFLLLCWIFFFFSILQICSGRKRVDFFFVVDDYKLVQNI